MEYINTIFTWSGNFSNVMGVVTALMATLVWLGQTRERRAAARRREMADQVIEIVLSSGAQNTVLPLHLRRADVSRAEVLGRMGMVPMREKGKRFTLAHLSTPTFLQGINEIAEGNTSLLTISCSKEEYAQFDL